MITDPELDAFWYPENLALVAQADQITFLTYRPDKINALGRGCSYRYWFEEGNDELNSAVIVFLPEGGHAIDELKLASPTTADAREAIIAHGGISACIIPDDVFDLPPKF